MRGLLIAIEGADGSGRTEQAKRLAQWFVASGREHAVLRLKGSPFFREPLRQLRSRLDISERALFLLYAADLADQLRFEAETALSAGKNVIFDKYVVTLAARAAVRGMDADWAGEVLSFAPLPDVTVLLEAPARQRVLRLLSRRRSLRPRETGIPARGSDHMVRRTIAYQRRLAEAYAALAPRAAVRLPPAPADVIEEAIRRRVVDALAAVGREETQGVLRGPRTIPR